MITNKKPNKSLNNSSYGTLYYTYYNPSLSYNKHFNIQKRQRSKDSYAEIAKEKQNLISYEIIPIQKYADKNNSNTIISKTQSCPKFTNKKVKNKIINKEIISDLYNQNTNKNKYSSDRKGVNYHLGKVEIFPYSTTLRNHSRIINNDKIKNLVENKEKLFNKRKRNYIGSNKINNKIKEIFKSNTTNNKDNNNFSYYKREKECNSGNGVCLGKKSIETYSFKDKNSQDKNKMHLAKNSSDIKNKSINNNINNENKFFILENKENINNNNNIENISLPNNSFKRKLNYEEEKNAEITNKTQTKNKVYQTLRKMKEYIENINSSLIKHNKEKQIQISNKENKKDKTLPKNNNNTIKNRIIKPSSCPKVLHSNNYTKEIIPNDSLKDNINKILQRNTELNKKQKYFFEKRKNYYLNINSNFVNNDNYEEEKLKKLLKKIPNNKNNKINKDIIILPTYKEKTINVKETNYINRNKNKNNMSSIMPPNNLKEVIFKKKVNFLFN